MKSNSDSQAEITGSSELSGRIVETVARVLGIEPGAIASSERLSRYGLDSQRASLAVAELSRALGKPMPATLFWDHPTIQGVVDALAGKDRPRADVAPTAVDDRRSPASDPIALVGISCRLPGAHGPEAYWSLLAGGVDAITRVPTDRWDVDELFHPDIKEPGKLSTRWGGFIDGIKEFDADFFGISPREALQVDPQQRLLLEGTWTALEDAGMQPASLRGSNTSVHCGAMWTDYARIAQRRLADIVQHTATGQDLSLLANRISYAFGLEGPSMAVNTACSSGLVAIHLACETLRSGESDVALAGSANLLIAPESAIAMSKMGAMAPDGRCKAFDARANGYVRGEGVAVLVLKRLSRARADGDRIYCTILGSAVNNDGFSNGLTAPNPQAQVSMLRSAYRRAGVDPREVDYVEAHGTGTSLGDPIEANALGAVLGTGRAGGRPLLIGSVKTNIGHLEAAAGMAGLIKVALSMRAGLIPPSLHFEKPNPHIDFAGLGLEVANRAQPWPKTDRPAIAGVSSFGFGGTNCHLVARQWTGAPWPPGQVDGSAPSEARRSARAGTAGTSAGDKSSSPGKAATLAGAPVVFVCSGHGAQWSGMAQDLIGEEPIFRGTLRECDQVFGPLTGWSVLDRLVDPHPSAEIPVHFAQPLIFSIQVALAALLRHRGIVPSIVVGHSLGEIAAAHLSGALDLEDAARVVFHRSRLIARTIGKGGMAVVGLAHEQLEPVLRKHGGTLAVAACNGPRTTIVSGAPGPLGELLAHLQQGGVFCRAVRADFASHSPQLDPLKQELFESLAGLQPVRCALPLVSTVTGDRIEGPRLDAAHWVRNLRQPVLFQQAIEHLWSSGQRTFLEVGPDAVLTSAVRESIGDRGGHVIASLRRGESARACLLRADEELLAARADLGLTVTTATAGLAAREPDPGAEQLGRPQLFVRSAHAEDLLRELVQNDAKDITARPTTPLQALCRTAALRRTHQTHRLAVQARSTPELGEKLGAFAQDGRAEGVWVAGRDHQRKVVFVFPGQGCQWLGMGRQLLAEEPRFRHMIARCDRLMIEPLGMSILSLLQEGRDVDTQGLTQPALFAMQVALADLWRSWGLVPEAVVGHSFGEIAAACVAGTLSLEHAVSIVCARRTAMMRISGKGAMALIELPRDQVERELSGQAGVGIAACNSRLSTVISGHRGRIEAIAAALQARGVFSRLLNVDVAGHSAQVDEGLEDFSRALRDLQPRPSNIPFYSSITGVLTDGLDLDAGYWRRNLREPVLFADATEKLIRQGYDAFLEISPHPIVSPALEQTCQDLKADALVIPTLRRGQDERECLLEAVARLHVDGVPLAWEQILAEEHDPVTLTPLPFRRQTFWPDSEGAVVEPTRRPRSGLRQHPLLVDHRRSSSLPDQHSWEVNLDQERFPWLLDHVVGGEVWFPAAAFIEMSLGAAGEVLRTHELTVTSMELHRPLPIEVNSPVQVQVAAGVDSTGAVHVKVSSATNDPEGWMLHASAHVMPLGPPSAESPWELDSTATQQDAAAHYQAMEHRHLRYGPTFRAVRSISRGPTSALVELRTAAHEPSGRGTFIVPSGIIDAGLQGLLALVADRDLEHDSSCTWVPARIDRLDVYADLRGAVAARLSLSPEDSRAGDISFVDPDGKVIARLIGVGYAPLVGQAETGDRRWIVRWRELPLIGKPAGSAAKRGGWLIVAPNAPTGPTAELTRKMREHGATCVAVTAAAEYQRLGETQFQLRLDDKSDWRRLLETAFPNAERRCEGVLYLSPAIAADGAPSSSADNENLLALVQALAVCGWRDPPSLHVATVGAQAVCGEDDLPNVFQAATWGFVRVAQLEHPEFRPSLIDLDPASPQSWASDLVSGIFAGDSEGQVAWRGQKRYGARLIRASASSRPAALRRPRVVDQTRLPVRLEIDAPGDLAGIQSVTFVAPPPRAGEVEIDVVAAGLNFLDVLKAVGRYPGSDPREPVQLGIECAGRVRRVGPGGSNWRPGDEVLAITPGAFASRVRVPEALVVRKPRHLQLRDAAAIPVAYATAHFALRHLADIQKGETVLVHSAATGTGLAAVGVARALGAEVLATAGSEEKRAFLRGLGVECVMDSRRGDFVREVRSRTGGRGVDVVLNSLTGPAMVSSLGLLAPYGRFVEIAKRSIFDNHPLELGPFRNALAFFAVDLARMWIDDRVRLGRILREVVELFDQGRLAQIPVDLHPVSQAATAFRRMASADHIGKLVLSFEEQSVLAGPPAGRDVFAAEGAYVITGGWGGLGLAVGRWLAERGARVIGLIGRGPMPAGAGEVIAEIERLGAKVIPVCADVNDLEALRRSVVEIENVAPLRGVVHAAGVLDDATILNLSAERVRRVMAPKVQGAWNLHLITRDRPLDLFLMFSSVTGLLGSPGQANYAAANTFLDALAHHRRALGLPAVSVAWGPWSEIGMAASSAARGERIASRGLESLSPPAALAALGRLLREGWTQIAIAPLSTRRWLQFHPKSVGSRFLAELTDEPGDEQTLRESSGAGVRARIEALAGAARRRALTEKVAQLLGEVLRRAPDRIKADAPFSSLGMDSLMALELRNRLEAEFEVPLSTTLVWRYPTLGAMVDFLAEKIGLQIDPAEPREDAAPVTNVLGLSASDAGPLLAALRAVDPGGPAPGDESPGNS